MERVKNGIGHIPFLILFLFMLLINQFVYLYGDDYRYGAYFGLFPQFADQEATMENIVKTQIYDYNKANGRFVTNVFTIAMLIGGIEIWRIVNPVLLTVLAYLIFYVVYVRFPKKEDLWKATVIVALLLLVHQYIARQTLYYVTGSFNYVYPMIYLLMVVAFFRRFDEERPLQNPLVIGIILFLALLAGWSQEQISVLTIGFILLWMIKNVLEKKKLQRDHVLVVLFALIGFLFLFLAPGPKLRAMSAALSEYNRLSLLGKLAYGLPYVMRFFIIQQPIYIFLAIFVSLVLWYQYTRRKFLYLAAMISLIPLFCAFLGQVDANFPFYRLFLKNDAVVNVYGSYLVLLLVGLSIYLTKKEKNYFYVTFCLGFISANLMMILTPSLAGGRVAFPAVPLGICFILYTMSKWTTSIKWRYALVLSLAIFAFIQCTAVFQGYKENAKIHEERIRAVMESKYKERGILELPPLKSKYYAGYELTDSQWLIKAFKKYYHIDDNVKIKIGSKIME